jgi:hypothetical protein
MLYAKRGRITMPLVHGRVQEKLRPRRRHCRIRQAGGPFAAYWRA